MDLKNRLSAVIKKDKQNNPKYVSSIIKSDFYYLISNYFEVDFDDIQVDIKYVEDKYFIEISCAGERIKFVNVLPE